MVRCSPQAISRLNRLARMYVDFEGPQGEELTPEALGAFLRFFEEQLREATRAMSHLQGLKMERERNAVVAMYVQAVEMAFQRDEPFIFSEEK